MNNRTIIYYTDDSLPDNFASRIRELLLKSAGSISIISVSQKPLDFGHNICVGDIGRSHLSMYRQLLAGGEYIDSDYVVLAEHDCLYTPEHINWTPPQKDIFYYNINHWFAQWNSRRYKGEYSYYRRKPLSQLICAKDIFIKAVEEKVWLLQNGYMIRKGQVGACEMGVVPNDEAFIRIFPCEPGVCDNRKEYIDALAQFKDLGKEIGHWKAKAFSTVLPNIDIRHGGNFSGRRRGRQYCYELPYWGKLSEIFKG